jgi:crossover junction endodeoxyribonuclease RusA
MTAEPISAPVVELVTPGLIRAMQISWDLEIFVPGHSAPQGSKRHVGGGVLVESSKRVKPWREHVAQTVLPVWGDRSPLEGPVGVEIEFVMPRPASTPKRRTPPAIKKPDVDKLLRAALDALTKVVWRDDSVITAVRMSKRLAELGEQPGMHLCVGSLS